VPKPEAAAPKRDPRPSPGAAERPLLSRASLLALCVAVAASTGLIHWQMIDVARQRQQLFWHTQIIEGHGPYPDQYRVLTYLLAQGLIVAGVPFSIAHALLRFVFTTASLYLFHQYLRAWVRPSLALLGFFMLAAALPLTFLYYFMQPTDPLNMVVYFLAFRALLAGRDAWLIPLVAVGMVNRETAALLPLLHACVRWGRSPLSRWLPQCLIAAAVAAAIYVGLRLTYGFAPPYAENSPAGYWAANFSDPGTWIQLLGFFNLALWVGWQEWRDAPAFLNRAAWFVPAFVLIHFSVGYVREVRYFLPLLPIVVPLTLLRLHRRAEVASPSAA
jgi:hypothetical protein